MMTAAMTDAMVLGAIVSIAIVGFITIARSTRGR